MADLDLQHEDRGLEVSADTLFAGKMICLQPRQGYRFSIDAILLAHFSQIRRGDTVLDLGCGCGIVGLIMLFRWPGCVRQVVGLEIQPELAGLAARNGRLNGFDEHYRVVEGDLRTIKSYFPAESFSRVVCNPPFYASSSGRVNAGRQARIARHQICASTDQVTAAAALVVQNKGAVSTIFPADRLVELIGSLQRANLAPKRMQLVYSYPGQGETAGLVLVEAIKNGGPGLVTLAPFYVYQKKNGNYSDEMQRLYDLHQENDETQAEKQPSALNTM